MRAEEFRQIVLWPLAVSRRNDRATETTAEEISALAANISQADSGWEWVPNGLDHIGAKRDDAPSAWAYQEMVYFHDFVARFLYRQEDGGALESKAPMPAFHLFRLAGLWGVDIQMEGGKPERRTLKVDRCNFYLFRTGVAVLALEVVNRAPFPEDAPLESWPLDEAMRFSDVFRRTYTPYFFGSAPAAVPTEVKWLFEGGAEKGPFRPRSLAEENERLSQREPGGATACDAPVAEHWSALLPPAIVVTGDPRYPESPAAFHARHVLDERMAVLSYIRLASIEGHEPAEVLAHVSESDWTRLCFVDQPGTGFPYSRDFLKDFDRDHAYDRFRDFGTRHLFSSYAYVMVCAGDFARDTLVHHFRRIYFQMALLAYMEASTYVAFSSRVSAAIERADRPGNGGIDGPLFKAKLFQVQRDLMDFVHRFRFTGVSNQVQAIEMYGAFRRHLRLDALFSDVKAELETATAYLRAADSDDQSSSAERLNVVASVGVALGLAISALGALPNFKGWVDGAFDKAATTTAWTSATFLGFAVASLGMMSLSGRLIEGRRRERASVRVIRWTLVAIAVLAAIGMVFSVSHHIITAKGSP